MTLEFGSDIVLDLHQFYQFDYLGWVMGRVDARPEYVFCMVEGLPAESRYKRGSLPNHGEAHADMIGYEASTAHTNTLLAQVLTALAGDQVKGDELMPPWAKKAPEKRQDSGGSVRQLHAAFLGGLAAPE